MRLGADRQAHHGRLTIPPTTHRGGPASPLTADSPAP
jgi:hypothetical protein